MADSNNGMQCKNKPENLPDQSKYEDVKLGTEDSKPRSMCAVVTYLVTSYSVC